MHFEPHRLVENQKTLLETLADPVFLILIDGQVEYMNPCAHSLFFECGSAFGKKVIQLYIQKNIKSLEKITTPFGLEPIIIERRSFSCHVGRFVGYKGDKLFWLVLRTCPAKYQNEHLPVSNYLGGSGKIVGSSEVMQQLQGLAVQVGQTDATVLITGESGTGKELVSKLVQQSSTRKDTPFLVLNCTTLNDELLANELFGHEKGAFTGASAQTKGKFEAAEGGTLFLDEIGEISPRMQAALLRVLESGEIVRVGGNYPIQVDVRVIAATSIDLPLAVQENRFRLDLFYRLNALSLFVPPLRQHREDILELADYFFSLYGKMFGREVKFTPLVVKTKLEAYDWPGNIRELQSVIQRAVLMSKTGVIGNEDLCLDTNSVQQNENNSLLTAISSANNSSLKEIVERIEREVILFKLAKHDGNVAETASQLNISRAALYDKMRRYNISAKTLR